MTSTPSPRAPFWARLLFAVALCMPIIEVIVVVLVWHVIGWWTLLALAACFCLGLLVIKRASVGAAREMRSAMAERRPPAREVADAPQSLVGGVLLLIPGFVTSLLGIILILPGMRSISRRLMQVFIGRRVGTGGVQVVDYTATRTNVRADDPEVIDGEIIDEDGRRDGTGR
ncbi:MAG TPA: FxsA family protein [Flexivirga sp.]|uniref:FxsA family protein n=1 Tax=Flexivirga sp. TaxID=1962927 RepID=UPI002CB5FEE5|nr:FxsA family protein [Flexivirga sp.]HWC22457.1 FxsA family protein [Flexivirga sp.]